MKDNMSVNMKRIKNYMKKNFRYCKSVGKLINMEIKNEMIIIEYEWKNHTSNKNFHVYFNTKIDYLRITWDEDGWRSLSYYKGEW